LTVSRALNTECDAHFGILAGAQRYGLMTHGLLLNALLSTWLFIYHLFKARSQNCEKRLLASSCLSVCPTARMEPAWNSLSPTGQIFMFDI
jgi:hypothetical protein